MQITINIKDSKKAKAFLNFIKSLDFVTVKESSLSASGKFKDIEQMDIPEWQKKEVRKRLEDYKKNPDQAMDFDTAMDDIEKDL